LPLPFVVIIVVILLLLLPPTLPPRIPNGDEMKAAARVDVEEE
jgi:hypothetical protein